MVRVLGVGAGAGFRGWIVGLAALGLGCDPAPPPAPVSLIIPPVASSTAPPITSKEPSLPLLFAAPQAMPDNLVGLRVERVTGVERLSETAQDLVAAHYFCAAPPVSRALSYPRSIVAQALLERWLRAPERLVEWASCGRRVRETSGWARHGLSLAGVRGAPDGDVRLLPQPRLRAPSFFVEAPDRQGLTEVRCVPSLEGGCDHAGFAIARVERYDRVAVGPLASLEALAAAPPMPPEKAARLAALAKRLDALPGDRWIWFPEARWVGVLGVTGATSPESRGAGEQLVELSKERGAVLGSALGADLTGPAAMMLWAPDGAGLDEIAPSLERARIAYAQVDSSILRQLDVEGRYLAKVEASYSRALDRARVVREDGLLRIDFTPSLTVEDEAEYRAERDPRILAVARVVDAFRVRATPERADLELAVDADFARRLASPASPGAPEALQSRAIEGLALPAGGAVRESDASVRVTYAADAARVLEAVLELLERSGWTLQRTSLRADGFVARGTRRDRSITLMVGLAPAGGLVIDVRALVEPSPR
jgi:hypothetical protein